MRVFVLRECVSVCARVPILAQQVGGNCLVSFCAQRCTAVSTVSPSAFMIPRVALSCAPSLYVQTGVCTAHVRLLRARHGADSTRHLCYYL